VLELGNKASVSRSKCPSVCVVHDMMYRNGQEGLDSKDQAFVQNLSLTVVDARN